MKPIPPTREALYNLYVVRHLTVDEMVSQVGYSRARIFYYLEKYGIERDKRVPFKTNRDPPEAPPAPPARPYTLEGRRKIPNSDWLRARYWDDNLNVTQIGAELGVNPNCITRELHDRNIPIKPRYLCWRDKPKRFGDFSASMRRRILERDHRCCQMCGTREDKLECHHIIPSRLGGRNSIDNGIALCSRCHDKVGFNELNWTGPLLEMRGKRIG